MKKKRNKSLQSADLVYADDRSTDWQIFIFAKAKTAYVAFIFAEGDRCLDTMP